MADSELAASNSKKKHPVVAQFNETIFNRKLNKSLEHSALQLADKQKQIKEALELNLRKIKSEFAAAEQQASMDLQPYLDTVERIRAKKQRWAAVEAQRRAKKAETKRLATTFGVLSVHIVQCADFPVTPGWSSPKFNVHLAYHESQKIRGHYRLHQKYTLSQPADARYTRSFGGETNPQFNETFTFPPADCRHQAVCIDVELPLDFLEKLDSREKNSSMFKYHDIRTVLRTRGPGCTAVASLRIPLLNIQNCVGGKTEGYWSIRVPLSNDTTDDILCSVELKLGLTPIHLEGAAPRLVFTNAEIRARGLAAFSKSLQAQEAKRLENKSS
jgi:hypothetical protein